MRGVTNGAETQARSANPHLLDIHGDIVHIVSNAAKEFKKPFGNQIESLCMEAYYDTAVPKS